MALTRFLIFIVTISALGSGEYFAKASCLSGGSPDSSLTSDDTSLKSAVTIKRSCQCSGLPPGYVQTAIDLLVPPARALSPFHPRPFKPKHGYATYYSGLSPPALPA